MAVELVVKIDENLYREIQRGNYGVSTSNTCAYAIRNGTPLPKGHGRLIDADAITKDFNTFQDSFAINLLDMGRGRLNIVCTAPTIIEADKGEEVGGATP